MASDAYSRTKAYLAKIGPLVERMPNTIRQNMIDTALELHENITILSPVDTGWFRLNNQIRFNGKDDTLVGTPETAKGMDVEQKSLDDAKQAMSLPIGNIKSIHLYNNTPYASKLENGSSKQAPAGVYNQAAYVAIVVLKRLLKKDGLL
jgi:hypothetical protein